MATATAALLNGLTPDDLYRARARVRHLSFMKYCWQRPDPFIESKQNPFQQRICERIDAAIKDYRAGKSSFICILSPFRHGKSDISSRYLPPHFLGEFPDAEVMVSSHTDDKANEFGDFGRTLLQSKEFQALYPGLMLSPSNRGVQEWGINQHFGKAQYVGIGSGTAGKGYSLGIVDDFFGKREHAESAAMREKVWQSFTDDIITRRAPVSIVLMVVTPWHVDDPIGRIRKAMTEDPGFPRFDFLPFPAFSDKYASGTLFPERFDRTWYDTQKSFLGPYGTSSLMQCAPQLREGAMFRTDKVQIIEAEEMPTDLLYMRGWDLASSAKQTTAKNDPDWTVGVKAAVRQIPTAVDGLTVPILYIDDVVRGQWEAPARQQVILDTTIADGASVPVGIEAFAAYKDAHRLLQAMLTGIRDVRSMQLPGDKVAKASPLVPLFEAGNVFLRRAPWNEEFLRIVKEFPGGAHDDDVDAMAVTYNMLVNNPQTPGMFSV